MGWGALFWVLACVGFQANADDLFDKSNSEWGGGSLLDHLRDPEPPKGHGLLDSLMEMAQKPSAPVHKMPSNPAQADAKKMADAIEQLERRMFKLRTQMAQSDPARWAVVKSRCEGRGGSIKKQKYKLNPKTGRMEPAYIKNRKTGRMEPVMIDEPLRETVDNLLKRLSDNTSHDPLLKEFSPRSFYSTIVTAYGEARGLDQPVSNELKEEVKELMPQLTPLAKNLGKDPLAAVARLLEPCSRANMAWVMEVIRNRAINATADAALMNRSGKVTAYAESLRYQQFSVWNPESPALACMLFVPDSTDLSFRQALVSFYDVTHDSYKGLGPFITHYVNNQCYYDANFLGKGEDWIREFKPMVQKATVLSPPPPSEVLRRCFANQVYSQAVVDDKVRGGRKKAFMKTVRDRRPIIGHVFLEENE